VLLRASVAVHVKHHLMPSNRPYAHGPGPPPGRHGPTTGTVIPSQEIGDGDCISAWGRALPPSAWGLPTECTFSRREAAPVASGQVGQLYWALGCCPACRVG